MKKASRSKNRSAGNLALVRRGESSFNELSVFTGWLDVPLTENGIKEAHQVASHCNDFNYDLVFTSHLERAHETLLIILSKQEKIGIFQHNSDKRYDILSETPESLKENILPIHSDRALNERMYGALQGLCKAEALKIYGDVKLSKWRRGFEDRPPEGESLKDVYKRAVAYFKKNILPELKHGKKILVVGHGNTLRAIIKFLEEIENDKIPFVYLPFGSSLVYEYKKDKFTRIEGEYSFERHLKY